MMTPPMFLPHSGANFDSLTATAPYRRRSVQIFTVRSDTACAEVRSLGTFGATYAVEKHSNLSQVAKKSFNQLL